MIMGHSESKYQRLETKRKSSKKFFQPLQNVHEQQVQGLVEFGSDTTEPKLQHAGLAKTSHPQPRSPHTIPASMATPRG